MHTNEFKNLGDMDKFLEGQKLLKFSQEVTGNLNSPIVFLFLINQLINYFFTMPYSF